MKIDKDLQKQEFSARLEQAAKVAGLHYYGMYTDVGKHFGMTAAGVRKWFVAEVMPMDKIEGLATYYRVRPEWLRSGTGPMKEVMGVNAEGKQQTVEIHNIPVIPPNRWQEVSSSSRTPDDLEKVLATGELPQGAFAIQVMDNSLADRVLRGMYVVVDPHAIPDPDDLAVAYINGSFVAGTMVRRDTIMIIPPNTDFRPVDLGPDPEICGVMISIVQQNLK